MRPSQWVKNIILFLPMFFAQEIGDIDRLWNVAILFTGFCLLTSGVYVFNDLMDAGEDRLHPVKRFRPIASRKVSPMAALVFLFLLYGRVHYVSVSCIQVTTRSGCCQEDMSS